MGRLLLASQLDWGVVIALETFASTAFCSRILLLESEAMAIYSQRTRLVGSAVDRSIDLVRLAACFATEHDRLLLLELLGGVREACGASVAEADVVRRQVVALHPAHHVPRDLFLPVVQHEPHDATRQERPLGQWERLQL